MKKISLFAIIFILSGLTCINARGRFVCSDACVALRADSVSQMSQADSLALAMAESMALMMADSMAVMMTDTTSIAVATDTALAVVPQDSTVVDSASLKKIVPDSLVVGYMPERRSWKYFEVKERPAKDVHMLKTLYKRTLADHNGALNAYDGWKIAFNSTNERTLDMYVDGVTMILSKVCADTINNRYDGLSSHLDELMELYDLAVYNVDALNAQLKATDNKDTLSIAKLRGRQLRYYRDIVLLDSLHNSDSTHITEEDWKVRINNDIKHVRFLYPRYKEIVASTDMNIDMADVAQFAILADSRIVRDKETGLDQATRKANFEQDCELVRNRVDDLMASINDPTAILAYDGFYSMSGRDTITVGRWFNSLLKPIDVALRAGEGRFIDASDFEALENYWAEKFRTEGDYDEVINSPLEKHKKSETYIQALRLKYDVEPTFELARKISARSYDKAEAHNVKDKNFADAITYLDRAFKFPEFKSQTPFAQARLYLNMARYQNEANRRNGTITYLDKAKSVCPDYPEIYFLEADWVSKAKLGNNKFLNGVKFCAVYDLYAKALAKIKELASKPDSEIKTNLSENDVKDMMAWCEAYFPDAAEAFMQGWKEGEVYPLSAKSQLAGRKYNTKIKIAKE